MAKLSAISQERLSTCDERLINLVTMLNDRFPVRVMCGHRNKADQDAAIKAKVSKTPWPKSKHNKIPSMAVDLLPEKLVSGKTIDWKNTKAFDEMANIAFECADRLGIHIRWGADWKMDGSKTEETFSDKPHIEIMERT